MYDPDDIDIDTGFDVTALETPDPVPADVSTAQSSTAEPIVPPTSPLDNEPLFGADTDNGWNVGINEDTGNTVSEWPSGYWDNGTWQRVEPK